MIALALKGLLIAVLAAVAGAWLATILIFRVLSPEPVPWQAPLLFTLPGSAMLSVIYGSLRTEMHRGAAVYAATIGAGIILGGLVLGLFVGLGAALVGAAYGGITSLCWVGLHQSARTLLGSQSSYGEFGG